MRTARATSLGGRAEDQIRRTGGPPTRGSGGRGRLRKDASPAGIGTGRAGPRSRIEAGAGTPGVGAMTRVSALVGPSQQREDSNPGADEDLGQHEAGRPARSGVAEHASGLGRPQGQVPRRPTPRARAINLEASRRTPSPETPRRRSLRSTLAKLNRLSTRPHPSPPRRAMRRTGLPTFPRRGGNGKTRASRPFERPGC
jgi:hypothetical protein